MVRDTQSVKWDKMYTTSRPSYLRKKIIKNLKDVSDVDDKLKMDEINFILQFILCKRYQNSILTLWRHSFFRQLDVEFEYCNKMYVMFTCLRFLYKLIILYYIVFRIYILLYSGFDRIKQDLIFWFHWWTIYWVCF